MRACDCARWFVGAVLCLALCTQYVVADDIVIQEAKREVDLQTQLVRIKDKLTFLNQGSSDVKNVVVCFPPSHARNQAFLQVQIAGKKASLATKDAGDVAGMASGAACSSVSLPTSLQRGATIDIDVTHVYHHMQRALPENIPQNGRQYMLYRDSMHIYSPYTVKTQSTRYKLPNGQLESYTTHSAKRSTSNNAIRYGPFKDVAPFSTEPVELHFENNSPFLEIPSLVREIQVSHWGRIYVEEQYRIRHGGAKHAGGWSRLDFIKPGGNHQAFIAALHMVLPASARWPYYKDEIGNISTSNVIYDVAGVGAALRPRFPLLGGWAANFVFGYTLPLEGFLYRLASGQNELRMSFASAIQEDYVIDDLTVKVVLPEGASDINVVTDHDVAQSRAVKYTYLDVVGRPVVVLKMHNVVRNHDHVFAVRYTFSLVNMLNEPLLLIAAFALLFAVVMTWVRLDFTISKGAKWHDAQRHERSRHVLQSIARLLSDTRNDIDAMDRNIESCDDASHIGATQKRHHAIEQRLRGNDEKLDVLLKDMQSVDAKRAAAIRKDLDVFSQLKDTYGRLLRQKELAITKPTSEVNAAVAELRVEAAELRAKAAQVRESLLAFAY